MFLLREHLVADGVEQVRLAQTDAAVDKQGVVRNARVLGDLQCCGPRKLVGFAGDKIVEIEVAVESSAIWRHDRGAMAGWRGWPRSGICNQSRGENKFHIDLAATQFRGKTHDPRKEALAHQLQHEAVGGRQNQSGGIDRARLRRQGADPGAELLRGHFLPQSAQASVPEIVHLRAYSLRAGLEAMRGHFVDAPAKLDFTLSESRYPQAN